MNSPDAEEFKAVLSGVFALYGKPLNPDVLAIWWECMRPYDLAAVKEALSRHAVNPDQGQYLPKPADVVRLIAGGTQDGALLAWSKVMRAISEVGTYRSVCFDDPYLQAVIRDMGGWPALGQVHEDELPFKAVEFQNRYRGYRTRGKIESWPARLLGAADQSNQARGFPLSEPALIGNLERAMRVLAGPTVSTTPVAIAQKLAERVTG